MSCRFSSSVRAGGLAAALALGACAGAGSVVDDFDPVQIRFITPTSASSPCLGDPTTPMCAAETLIGCAGRVWNEGCPKVNFDFDPSGLPRFRIEYVIVKAGFVNKEKVRQAKKDDPPPGNPEPGQFSWLTEDAFQVLYFGRHCPAEAKRCWEGGWYRSMLTVSPYETYWTFSLVGHFLPGDWFVD